MSNAKRPWRWNDGQPNTVRGSQAVRIERAQQEDDEFEATWVPFGFRTTAQIAFRMVLLAKNVVKNLRTASRSERDKKLHSS